MFVNLKLKDTHTHCLHTAHSHNHNQIMVNNNVSSFRRVGSSSTFKPSKVPTGKNKTSHRPSLVPKAVSHNENTRHNQLIATLLVLSVVYMICIIAIIQRRKMKRRGDEAQRISTTAHPSRPLHPMSQQGVII